MVRPLFGVYTGYASQESNGEAKLFREIHYMCQLFVHQYKPQTMPKVSICTIEVKLLGIYLYPDAQCPLKVTFSFFNGTNPFDNR